MPESYTSLGIEKPYHYRQWLIQKYHGELMTIEEIAELCGVCLESVRYYMRKFGIKRRDRNAKSVGPGYRTRIIIPSYLLNTLKKYMKTRGEKLGPTIRTILLERMIKEGFNPFKED